MKDKVSITELAKLRNITTETLRHYDRIGLLKPDSVDKQTGYRYYSLSQIEMFDTIIDLKNMGLSLKEIQEFMSDRNLDSAYSILQKRERDIRAELEEKQRQLLLFQSKMEFIRMSRELDENSSNGWKVKRFTSRKFIVSKADQRDISDFFYEFTKLRANLKNGYEIFGTDIYGSIINKDSFIANEGKRFYRFPALLEGRCFENVKYGEVTTLPGGEYLCCYGRGICRPGERIHDLIMEYLDSKHLKIVGDIHESSMIDASLTDNENEKMFRLEIPVKKL